MPKILIVDDERPIIQIMQILLSRQGFEIVSAERGDEGLILAEVEAPDIIILDMMLPDLDGPAFCQQLRRMPTIAHIPIIALSARVAQGDQDKALAAGANAYLTKPADTALLIKHLHSLLNET